MFLLLIRTTLANRCFHSLCNNSNMTKTFQVNQSAKGIPVASAAKELNKILQRTNHVVVRGKLEPGFPVCVYVKCTGSANHSDTSLPNVLDSDDFTNHKKSEDCVVQYYLRFLRRVFLQEQLIVIFSQLTRYSAAQLWSKAVQSPKTRLETKPTLTPLSANERDVGGKNKTITRVVTFHPKSRGNENLEERCRRPTCKAIVLFSGTSA